MNFNLASIIILIIIAAAVVLAAVHIKRNKNKCFMCNGDCENCTNS